MYRKFDFVYKKISNHLIFDFFIHTPFISECTKKTKNGTYKKNVLLFVPHYNASYF